MTLTTIPTRLRATLLLAGLALAACDSGGDEITSTSSSSTGGETSDSATTDGPTGVSVSITATSPTTDPATTDSATDGTTTDGTTGGVDTDAETTDEEPTTSGEGGSTSTGGFGSTSTGEASGVTIYDVQDGTVAEGTMVTVEGVAITGIRDNVGVYVQEVAGGPFSGVYVDTGDLDLSVFSIGDLVTVSGVTSEDIGVNGVEGLTAIMIGDGMGTMEADGGTMELSPEAVTPDVLADAMMAEPYEGVLVSTTGMLGAVPVPGNDFGQFSEFAVADGEAVVVIDDFLFSIFAKEHAADFMGFGEGAMFTAIQGPLNFSFGNHKIAPRSAADFEGYMAPAAP
ncbi:MAG: hypothetical protein AAGA54_09670 [Myxococcota bacterium]